MTLNKLGFFAQFWHDSVLFTLDPFSNYTHERHPSHLTLSVSKPRSILRVVFSAISICASGRVGDQWKF